MKRVSPFVTPFPEWRRERVKELRAKGMSTREIAKEVGASQAQVRRDLEAVGTDVPPDPQPAPVEAKPKPRPEPPPPPERVKGKDGKSYSATLAPALPIAYPVFMLLEDPPPLPEVPGVEFRPVPGCPDHAAGSDGSVWKLSPPPWPCRWPRRWSPVRVFERPGGAVVPMREEGRSGWRRVEEVVAAAFG